MSYTLPKPHALVGRDDDVAALSALLAESGHHLVTVWGPIGVGKSALIGAALSLDLHGSSQVRVALPDSLAATTENGRRTAPLLAEVLLEALGVPFADGADAMASLVKTLCRRGRFLVCLDGAEAALEAVESLLEAVMPLLPETRFLVGSRVLLGRCRGLVHQVAPLSPDDGVALFHARAQNIIGGAGEAEYASDIAKIVEFLGGIPRAIEIAAAKTAILGYQELWLRLQEPLTLLVDPHVPQHSFRSAFALAWDGLDPDEQVVLAQLSVFHGWVRVTMVEAVVDPVSRPVLDVVQSLYAKSLVLHEDSTSNAVRRLRLGAVLRVFAAERLGADDATLGRVMGRYAGLMRDTGHALQRAYWRGEHKERLGFKADLDSVLAALDAGLAERQVWAAELLSRVLYLIRKSSDRDVFQQRLEASTQIGGVSEADRLRIALERVEFDFTDGRLQVAMDRLADTTAPQILVDPVDAVARYELAQAMRHGHSYEAGQRHARIALHALAVEDGCDETVYLRLLAMSRLAIALSSGGTAEAVESVYREGLALAVKAGHRSMEMLLLNNYGAWLALEGGRQRAIVCSERALVLSEMFDDEMIEATCALNLGESHFVFEQDLIAQGYFERARRVAERRRLARVGGVATGYLGALHHVSGRLEEASLAYADGHKVLVPSERDALSVALLDMCMGALDCERGAMKRAAARFAAAEVTFKGCQETTLLHALAIQRVLLGLPSESDDVLQTQVLSLWQTKHPPRTPPHAYRKQHIDFAYRLVLSAIRRRSTASFRAQGIIVEGTGSWFVTQDGQHVSLGRRRAPRRVLAFLANLGVAADGKTASTADLFAVGWPDETLNPIHAANRLYFAIATLRQLGLGDSIQHIGDGYRFDPAVRLTLG